VLVGSGELWTKRGKKERNERERERGGGRGRKEHIVGEKKDGERNKLLAGK